ncbi:MAG: hypothetical protein JW807_09085 [Spirochaetes bacterium]|nr:hypothetical protein [Spirochaetota bacterium]
MKVNEVPQDGRQAIGDTTMINYAVNENGKIVPVQSSGWDVQILAVHNLADTYEEWAAEAKERVRNNQSSPIEYFMYHYGLDLPTLAQQMGLSQRKVKKHMKPEVFEKLDDEILGQYAGLFQIDVSEIKNFKKGLA